MIFYIRAKVVQNGGKTPGCPGCAAALGRGRDTQHSQDCKTRFSNILADRGYPRIERWKHKLVDEMQMGIEDQGMREASSRQGQASISSGEE